MTQSFLDLNFLSLKVILKLMVLHLKVVIVIPNTKKLYFIYTLREWKIFLDIKKKYSNNFFFGCLLKKKLEWRTVLCLPTSPRFAIVFKSFARNMKNVSRKTWSLFIPYMTKNLIALRRSNLQSEIIRDTNFTKHVRIMFFFCTFNGMYFRHVKKSHK